MLLRNFYNQLTTQCSGRSIANSIKAPDGTLYPSVIPNSSYAWYELCSVYAFQGIMGVKSSYRQGYICLGSGDTPATVDDYKLENLIETTLNSSKTMSLDGDGNFVIIMTVTNGHTEPITIREMGIVAKCFHTNSGYVDCLVERTVLDEPVTIAAGETGFVSYKVRFAPVVGAFPS